MLKLKLHFFRTKSFLLLQQTYQFWTRTDEEGNFTINHVRVGNYNLYGWVNGFIGDFKYNSPINITTGKCSFILSNLIHNDYSFIIFKLYLVKIIMY